MKLSPYQEKIMQKPNKYILKLENSKKSNFDVIIFSFSIEDAIKEAALFWAWGDGDYEIVSVRKVYY